MSSKTLRKIISISMVLVMVFVFASCSNDKKNENDTQPDAQNSTTVQTNADVVETTAIKGSSDDYEGVTEAETTTEAEATTEDATSVIAGSAVQPIIDTLAGKNFYLVGTIHLNSGESIDMSMSCEGDNYKLDMKSKQMDMGMCYIGGNPYIINNTKKQYVLFDEAAIDSLDEVLSSMSSLGISMGDTDMSQMKDMMTDFDQNMDFSQYINEGEFFEYQVVIDGETYFCSTYETDYGSIKLYTLDGKLKTIDIYDADGLRQVNIEVVAFSNQIFTPVTLNGLTQASSILNLFGIA